MLKNVIKITSISEYTITEFGKNENFINKVVNSYDLSFYYPSIN